MFLSVLIAFIIVAILYSFIILYFTIGWDRIENNNSKEQANTFSKISIIIPFYNEEKNIDNLLKDLSKLEYPKSNFEILLVDNNSTDNTAKIVKQFILENDNIQLLQSDNGKKEAVWKAINTAKHDYILSIDADCRIPSSILINYNLELQEHPYKFISGPVAFTSNNSLFAKFMELEFLSLVASGAGSISIKKPIMANAANMLFAKDVALSAEHIYKSKEQSGDDIFLLEYVVDKFGPSEVQFLKKKEAIITTPAPENFKAWINQRLRWASKAKHYSINAMSLTALVIFAFNFLIFLIFPLIQESSYLLLWAASIALKTIVDYGILSKSAKFFSKQSLVKYILLFEIVYPIYIVGISLGSLSFSGNWKGR